MTMVERLGNLGYMAFKTEATKGVPVIPDFFIPFFEESLSTNANLQSQEPVYGGKFATYDTLRGQRDHKGELTVMAEPNIMAHILDMTFTLLSTTGAGPYTRTYGLSSTANPHSKTIDISTGNIVKRFWGVEAGKLSPNWNNNELQMKVGVSALGSFQGRTITSISTTTVVLDTKYDPTPNKGLVVGDLVRIYKASTGATLDTTIATVNVDGITITLAASAAAFAAGDVINLRPATVSSFNILPTFLWAKTQFCFADTYANAVAATQYRVETGSTFELQHQFEDDGGAKRSGGFDPAALVRGTGKASVNVKQFFDTPEKVQQYNDLTKSAIAIRHYAGDTNQYELRVGFNRIITDTPVANVKAGDINYSNIKFIPNFDSTDGVALTLTSISGLSSL